MHAKGPKFQDTQVQRNDVRSEASCGQKVHDWFYIAISFSICENTPQNKFLKLNTDTIKVHSKIRLLPPLPPPELIN